MELNLNLNDYDLNDILKLFKIPSYQITDEMVKNAKKVVTQTHPDKSGLPGEYFIFFKNAFEILLKIKDFQNKKNDPKRGSKLYQPEIFDENSKQLLVNDMHKSRQNNFNSWFNEQYEQHYGENTLSKKGRGYGDWIKSEDGFVATNNISSVRDMDKQLELHRKNIGTIVSQNEIIGVGASSNNYCDLEEEAGEVQNSGYVGSGYADLRQSHVESIIPVTHDDYMNMPKFDNVNSYRAHRERQDIRPLSNEECQKQMLHQENLDDARAANMTYKFFRQEEEYSEKEKLVWKSLQNLTQY